MGSIRLCCFIDDSLRENERACVRFWMHYKAIEVAFLSSYESLIEIVCFSNPIHLWRWSLFMIIKRQPYTNRNDACQMNETAASAAENIQTNTRRKVCIHYTDFSKPLDLSLFRNCKKILTSIGNFKPKLDFDQSSQHEKVWILSSLADNFERKPRIFSTKNIWISNFIHFDLRKIVFLSVFCTWTDNNTFHLHRIYARGTVEMSLLYVACFHLYQ